MPAAVRRHHHLRIGDGPLVPPLPPPPLPGAFPTETSVGVPAGWTPTSTHPVGLTIEAPGLLLEDADIVGDLRIRAPDVTVRRCRVTNGNIHNSDASTVYNGLLVEDCTLRALPEGSTEALVATGGYTARRVLIQGSSEGFRVGGLDRGADPVTIEDCYVRCVGPNVSSDWHGDALQAFQGPAVTVTNTVLILGQDIDGEFGTSAFFHPDQGNTRFDVDRLICQGGGYSFRSHTPGDVANLFVVRDEWRFGPRNVDCDLLDGWEAHLCRLDPDGQPTDLTPLGCD